MSVELFEYTDVRERAEDLGCNSTLQFAILPRNFQEAETKEDLVHEDATLTIRSLWRQAGVDETRLEKDGERFPTIQENAFEWLGPTIFVGASLASQNPEAVSVALNIVSNYLTDWFKGVPGSKKVHLDIVVEQSKDNKCVRISYTGDVEGMNKLPDIVREVSHQ